MAHGIHADTKIYNNQKHKELVKQARQNKPHPMPVSNSITIEQLDKIAAKKKLHKKHILRKAIKKI